MTNYDKASISLRKKIIVLTIISIITVSSTIYIVFLRRKTDYLSFLESFKYLPATVTGFTYFNLITLRNYYNETILKSMYFLNENFNLTLVNALILSSNGTYIIYENGSVLNYDDSVFVSQLENSIYGKIYSKVSLFYGNNRRIDVLGYINDSRTKIKGDSFLSVNIENGLGNGIAVFEEPISTYRYELLEAVGVKYLKMEQVLNYYYVYYTNTISVHIDSGIMNNFTSTQHCVNFFLYGGILNELLETSLRRKIRLYASNAATKGINYVYQDVESRTLTDSPIIVTNMSSNVTFWKGNIAPYGLVLRVLKDYKKNYTKLENYLVQSQTDNLWPYHSGYISTSIDSSLVFEGILNQTSINLTKTFMKNSGGFLGQLNDTDSPYSMNSTPQVEFWCQEDYGTTAACYYFLDQITEANQTTLAYLKDHFDDRSSLWIANPYFIDYLTARAIYNQSGTEELCINLTKNILSQRILNGTWGSFDTALSTAFAILALEALNYSGYEVDYARYKLTLMQNPDGSWNSSNIFYWALYLGENSSSSENLYVNGNYYEYFLCEDRDPIITTSVVLLALENNSRLYGETISYELIGPHFDTLPQYLANIISIYDIY
ncbi:MAG: hypothetical protein ACFFD2_02620 [Promethearchaeota archaeon]